METSSTTDLHYDRNLDVGYKIRKVGFPVLGFLCFVLLVVCIVLGVLYYQAKALKNDKPAEVVKYDICDTDECFYLGMDLVKTLNKSVDPCEDFYRYACGGWQHSNPLKEDETVVTGFSIVQNRNLNILKTALENAPSNYSKNEAVMKTARAYNSCIDISSMDARGTKPLIDLIKRYGGWSITGNYNSSMDLLQRIGTVARDLNVNSFIGVQARTDIYDSSSTILEFIPATLGMNYDYYLSEEQDKKQVLSAYYDYMTAVGKALGGSKGQRKMADIYSFEMKLAKIASGKDPEDELLESLVSLKRQRKSIPDMRKSLDTFCTKTGFRWSTISDLLRFVFNNHIDASSKVLMVNEAYYTRLSTIFDSYRRLDPGIIADYVMWRVLDKYIDTLPSSISSLKLPFFKALGEDINTPRWKDCIKNMLDVATMPLGLLFIDTHFDDATKKSVEEMTELVRQSFIDRLPVQYWMDAATQKQAKDKALAIKVDIGYPPFIRDPEKLAAMYREVNISDDWFENLISANRFVRLQNINSYGNPVDKDQWFYSPARVNGYYSPQQNRIVFLAGIIQPPFYEPKYPRYLKYGAIGMVIGHEITHGFDGTGRLYDKYGNLREWWSAGSSYNFMRKASCIVNQYDTYKVFDKYVNGTKTLNENIADNGGIKLAYEAYMKWTKIHGNEKILPGLALSPEQLFFVGFAQPWCSIYKKSAAYRQLQTDPHSFPEYRVFGSLANFDKFSKAFKCSSKSRMNPTSKCSVW
ncbi:endothelin-converting enzyme homolog [Nematostella vectensis]|uniref:endothelin-converting enzyme homolog n=1 Tax=Nematostella vectensis TaxID=45351 RepID=UPI002077007D|nr:endothelin-converting enzyme homolog [Nematostella vectensis]